MKKMFSLIVAILMVLSIIPTSLAWIVVGDQCPTCSVGTIELCQYCQSAAICSNVNCERHNSHKCDTEYQNGTVITLVGSASEEYTVNVPAKMGPGDTGVVSVSGNWSSDKTLHVTCPNSVELTYGDKSTTIGIQFDGIHQKGNDLVATTATANLTVEEKTVLFGTWTGVLEYTVSCETNN